MTGTGHTFPKEVVFTTEIGKIRKKEFQLEV
jgi:hypothetical protein